MNIEEFKEKITDKNIAQEIINGIQDESLKRTFEVFLLESDDPETWEILRERLSGFLVKNQP
ncbi:hypothetical protein [Nostoc sp.]|uniref:hypothetical protein n=1 Tax=Nostoc sp. TaxID=1180 RepID=UPI002FF56950